MYSYKKSKSDACDPDNQLLFLAVRDKAKELTKVSGVFKIRAITTSVEGDVDTTMACVDRLVELGEVVDLTSEGTSQVNRVFASN